MNLVKSSGDGRLLNFAESNQIGDLRWLGIYGIAYVRRHAPLYNTKVPQPAVYIYVLSIVYELVRACYPKFCQPLLPLAIATPKPHMLYHGDRREQWKRMIWRVCTEYSSRDQSQAFKGSITVGHLPYEENKLIFSERAASRCSTSY